jgi:two-component system, LuxR family, sensor kinase FixL
MMEFSESMMAADLLQGADHQSKLVRLGEIAGSIIHEVNQPIAAITCSADAALRWLDRDNPDVVAAVESI